MLLQHAPGRELSQHIYSIMLQYEMKHSATSAVCSKSVIRTVIYTNVTSSSYRSGYSKFLLALGIGWIYDTEVKDVVT